MDMFRLELFTPGQVYFSGQEIQGQIHIHLSEPKKTGMLKLELCGEGRVHWTETRNVERRTNPGRSRREIQRETETIHHRSHERYLEQEIVLFHGPQLAVGIHVFPFSIFLGPNLPSSFEGQHGHIRYYLQAVIVRDWLWNHRTKQHITVNSILDLNLFNSCKQPQHTRDHKHFCCFCCKSGPVSVVMHTDRTGYVSGENIVFSAEVDNKSNKEMQHTNVQLVESVTFKAGGHHKTTSRTVAEQRRGRVGPGDSDIWDRVPVRVPPLPPSNLGGSCGIIQLQYALRFSVHPDGMGFALNVELPITIGSIPLQNYFNSFNQFPEPHGLPYPDKQHYAPPGVPTFNQGRGGGFVPQPDVPPPYNSLGGGGKPPYNSFGGAGGPPPASAPPLPDNFTLYDHLPPPTYQESYWGEVNVKHEDDDENTTGSFVFVPKYVTYSMNQNM